jgi:hypothetical protein
VEFLRKRAFLEKIVSLNKSSLEKILGNAEADGKGGGKMIDPGENYEDFMCPVTGIFPTFKMDRTEKFRHEPVGIFDR